MIRASYVLFGRCRLPNGLEACTIGAGCRLKKGGGYGTCKSWYTDVPILDDLSVHRGTQHTVDLMCLTLDASSGVTQEYEPPDTTIGFPWTLMEGNGTNAR